MKKVLVLNGDSYVGRHVVKAFYQSYEYEVEITRTCSDTKAATTARAVMKATSSDWLWGQMKGLWNSLEESLVAAAADAPDDSSTFFTGRAPRKSKEYAAPAADAVQRPTSPSHAGLSAEERNKLPADIRFCVSSIVPKHNDNTEEFRKRLLANDVVIAVLQDDIYEAMCAIRILAGTHYDVEKTFVLVSSAVTWAYTLTSERARARATRQREREEERKAFVEEIVDAEGEENDEVNVTGEGAAAVAEREALRSARCKELEQRLPFSLREPAPGEDEAEIRELVPDRVFTDDAYAQRVPHPRFQHWNALEHLVKRSNSETLHTYVVFAGLPYGAGEGSDMLFGLLRSAWHHQVLPQYGAGVNEIPMIHVQDLASILYKVGSAYDVLEERYMFAVDQGHVTQRQLLHAVQARFGGSVQPAVAVSSSIANASAVDLVRLDRLELPPPTSPEELFAAFGNKPCWGDGGVLLSALVLSDIQAEPSTVLTMHGEDEWVALDGFLANLDITCAQFRAAHAEAFKPVRALITGPPLSGAETVAALLAQRCRAPCVSRENIVSDYKAHVADVRAALRRLLMRRLQRRRARVQARLVLQAAEEKAAERLAKEEQRREKRQQRDDTDDDSGSEDELDEEGPATEESKASDAEFKMASSASLLSIFLPPTTKRVDNASDDDEEEEDDATQPSPEQQQQQPLRPIELVVNEAYIRGAADADADADGDEESGAGIDEEQEDEDDGEEGGNWFAQLDARDEEAQADMQEDRELLPPVPLSADAADAAVPLLAQPRFAARSRGRAFARDVDRQELRCIAALRQEYLLGLKVLALKVSAEGRLPRPPPTPATTEDYEGYGNEVGRSGSGNESEEDSDEGSDEEGNEEEEEGKERTPSDETPQALREGANDDAGEDEDADSYCEPANPADDTNPLLAIDFADDGSAYLDCALAFMCRWRLRQSDCRCQGYILSDFPQTLAQAVLCFRANEAELQDAELRRQRVLAPFLARSDDHAARDSSDADDEGDEALAPIDADFPLPDIANMEEEELVALERAHRRGRGPANGHSAVGGMMDDLTEEAAASDDAEAVMEPVDESLFVDHVVALQADPSVLRATIDALQTSLDVSADQQLSATPQSGAAPSVQGATLTGSTGAALAALRASLHATPYAEQLEWYMTHHTATSPPTRSLLSWLSAITTTPALGVQHARVIVPPSNTDGAADVEDADDVDATDMGAPPTTRTAQMHFVSLPVLNIEELKACWRAASERKTQDDARAAMVGMAPRTVVNRTRGDECGSALVDTKLPVTLMRLAPLCWTGAAAPQSTLLFSRIPSLSAHTSHTCDSRAASRRTSLPAASLVAFARELCARIAPMDREPAGVSMATVEPVESTEMDEVPDTNTKTTSPVLVGATTPASEADIAAAFQAEADTALKEAADSTEDTTDSASAERQERFAACSETEASEILRELASLRRLQIVEGGPDTADMLELPVETYLMKYVLPNLTPVMTDVVRMRPHDPVSMLADVLFERRRRVTL